MTNKLFIRIIKENSKETTLAILFNILYALSVTLVSYSLTFLFDAYQSNQYEFYNAMMLVGVIVAVTILLSFLSDYFKAKYIRKTNRTLKLKMADSVMDHSYDLIAIRDTGKAMSWFINDAGQIESQAFSNFISAIYLFTIVISAIASLFLLHWIIAVVSLVFLCVILILPNVTQRYIVKAQSEYTDANEKYTESIRDNFEGLGVFFIGGALTQFKNNVQKAIELREKQYFSFSMTQAKVGSIMLLMSLMSQIGLLAFALFLVSIGWTSAGSILSVASLAGNLFNGAQGFIKAMSTFKAADVLLNKFEYVKEEKPAFSEQLTTITLKNIALQYNDNKLFDDFSFEFYKNQKYIIVGESGSGKSTLLKLILGLTKPQFGQVQINDIDLHTIDLKTYYKNISYIDQSVYLMNGTIKDNITLGENVSEKRLNQIIQAVKLQSFINKQEFGLDTMLNSNGQYISGGEKQRIALARALIKNVAFIIIDESTSQLDKETRVAIEQTVLDLENVGLIYVSHHTDPNVINKFDQLIDSKLFK
ncbi:ABC transporter ATP-binding protein [Carnobacteriaceae bacterium zg-C25]|nr:ABC transporter ATP-binding protein [Carnobacteriaceae bacterium zg-C25]